MALNLSAETIFIDDPSATQTPLMPGELAPHFPQLEILECLGRGGMGVVYKARQKSLNRVVALKLLAPERVADAKFAQRFAHEAQALATLNHPSIVTIHDFGQAGGFYFLLMEFVDGVNLRQAMKAGRFTPGQALAIVPPVCEALQYAHEHGIVHRDIKPENLLMDKAGRVKIADFGIAKLLHTDGSDVGLADSQPVGTPQYMAPEQKAHRSTDHRADVYSLGVVLYELLTGELPAEKLQPPSSRIRGMQIDVRLDEIVLRALKTKPELRYQTAGEMRTQLETISAGNDKTEIKSPKTEITPPSLQIPAVVLGLAYTALLVWLAASSLVLPERIAWRFDWHGNAISWMSGRAEILLMAALSLVLAALFWFTARSAVHVPRLLYIPRRDYWLAPERRELTSALLLQQLLWLATVLTISLGALHMGVVEANTHTPPRFQMAGLILCLVIVFAGVIICIVRLTNRFAGATAAEARTQVEAAVSAHGSNRREGASVSSNPSRLIKTGFSARTTPEQLSTAAGQFLICRRRGQLILDDHQLTHSDAGTNTVIPLAAIRDLSVGKMPRAVAPLGLELLSVTYEEGGQLKRLLLSPTVAWFAFPWTYNQHVAEWFTAVRDAVTAATGSPPTRTPADQLDLPRSNPAILLMHGVCFMGILLLLGMLLTRPGGTPMKTVAVPGTVIVVNHSILFLIAFVGGGCLSLLIIRGIWRRMNRSTPDSSMARAATSVSGRLHPLAIAGMAALAVFAILLGVHGLSRRPTVLVDSYFTPVRLEKNMVILDFRAVVTRGSCEAVLTLGGSGWLATGGTVASRPMDLSDGTEVITPGHPKRVRTLNAGLNEWRAAFVLPDESLANAAWENLQPLGPLEVRSDRQTGGMLFSERTPKGELYEASFLVGPAGLSANGGANTGADAGPEEPRLSGTPGTQLHRREVNGVAPGGQALVMTFEELQRDAKTSTAAVKSVGGGSVDSAMLVTRGAYDIARARGAAYFINLKEWEAQDGARMYLVGFAPDKNVNPQEYFGLTEPLADDPKHQFLAVKVYERIFKDQP